MTYQFVNHIKNKQFHFFASNFHTWITTNDERSLLQLIKDMEKMKVDFNLWYVPVSHETNYEIKYFQPVVEGIIYLGTFNYINMKEEACT